MTPPQQHCDLNTKIDMAISCIQKYEPLDGYWVSFSGGKDSIVVYDLVKRSKVKFDVHFNQTTIDPPEVYSFIRENYPEVVWEHPKRSMFAAIRSRQIPPTRRVRYCCSELKELHGCNRVMITGVRQQESAARRKREEYDSSRHNNKTTYCNPIVTWTEDDVWTYIKTNNLKYPLLYDNGYSRIGCIMCPLQGRYGMCKDALKYPKYYRAYMKSFEKVLQNCHDRKPKEKLSELKWKSADDIMFWWIYGIHRVDCKKTNWKLPFEPGFDLESVRPKKRTGASP